MRIHKTALLFLCMILLTGCKNSPESDIVANKNEDKLEKAITQEADGQVPDTAVSHKEDEFQVSTNDLKVEVDADVKVADGNIPVIKTVPHEITSEDLKTWGTVLFDGKTAYDPGVPMSKKELEKEILLWKQKLGSADLEEEYGEEADSVKAAYEEVISNLEKQYKDAPEQSEIRETDYTFHPYEYYLSAEGISLENERDAKDMKYIAQTEYDEDGIRWEILATNRKEQDYSMHAMDFYGSSMEDEVTVMQDECPEKEALGLAEETRKQLGFRDWELYATEESQENSACKHMYYYTRKYEGVPTLTGYDIDLQSEDLYAANLYYEALSIKVTNGKVTAVSWYSPMDIVQVENTNVKMLSFDEVYKCFKSQMQSQYSKNTYLEKGWFDEGDDYLKNADMSVRINEIEQGLFRIKIRDNSDEYRMVPAWIFKGSTFCDGDFLMEESYVVINAVDGSVINSGLGY